MLLLLSPRRVLRNANAKKLAENERAAAKLFNSKVTNNAS